MDAVDWKILDLLQRDATIPIAEIADRVNLSQTPCWRRVQRLEEDGYILGRVALLSPKKVGLGVTVFAQVKTCQHNKDWFHRFNEVVQSIPEVVEFYRMSGNIDYLLRIVVPDIEGYDAVYQRLIANTEIFDVSSHFSMEQLKYTTTLPISLTR